jgi:hypothetical protein
MTAASLKPLFMTHPPADDGIPAPAVEALWFPSGTDPRPFRDETETEGAECNTGVAAGRSARRATPGQDEPAAYTVESPLDSKLCLAPYKK